MKKKICFIVSSPFTALFLKNHLKVLSKEFDLYLVANFNDENINILNKLELTDYKSISINRNINPIKDIIAVYKLFKYFNAMNFEATHSITPKAGLISAISSKFAGISKRVHIFTGQVWATKKSVFRFVLRSLDKVIARLSTHVLIDGHSQKEFLIQEKVIEKHEGIVLGAGSISGVNINQFCPNSETRKKIRKGLNLSEDTVIYLFLGRLNFDKGIIELAHAFNKLSNENDKTFLLLVGIDEDSMLDQIDKIITNKNAYHFAGLTYTPEIYYQTADVFCLPSHREGFGSSVIEASACKIPVICSDAYGLMDTIKENSTGLRHKVMDSKDLFNQMEKLYKDDNLRESLGCNGLTYVRENFSAETISKEWLNFYKEIM